MSATQARNPAQDLNYHLMKVVEAQMHVICNMKKRQYSAVENRFHSYTGMVQEVIAIKLTYNCVKCLTNRFSKSFNWHTQQYIRNILIIINDPTTPERLRQVK